VNPNSGEECRDTDEEFDNNEVFKKFLSPIHQVEKRNQRRFV